MIQAIYEKMVVDGIETFLQREKIAFDKCILKVRREHTILDWEAKANGETTGKGRRENKQLHSLWKYLDKENKYSTIYITIDFLTRKYTLNGN